MEEILKMYGFTQVDNSETWVKGEWTIRVEDDRVEAFSNTYYTFENRDKILDILNDINLIDLEH